MKAAAIKVVHYHGEESAVFVEGRRDSTFYSGDRKERAEKRRQELIDALPKPHWRMAKEPNGIFLCGPEGGCQLNPLMHSYADRILALLNEAEE